MAVVTVSRLGKDIGIKIPARIAASLGIREGDEVEVNLASGKRIVIHKPKKPSAFNLDGLIHECDKPEPVLSKKVASAMTLEKMNAGEIKKLPQTESFINSYAFLKSFKDHELVEITNPKEDSSYVWGSIALTFDDGNQIALESDYYWADMLVAECEDVLFTVRAEQGYKPFSWTKPEDRLVTTAIKEKPRTMKLVFEEFRFGDSDEKVICYPIALFTDTESRRIGIWRDVFEGFYLNIDYSRASYDQIFEVDELGWISEREFVITRYSYDYFSDHLEILGIVEDGGPDQVVYD